MRTQHQSKRELDKIDRNILRILQSDGRISFTELGEKVGLDSGTLSPLLKRLEAAGLRLERTAVGDRYVVERMREGGFNLGGEQSGHIAGVGFDLYLRMIGEAVAEFKGEKFDSPSELKLEIPVDAHIPAIYVESERLRLEAYHKLSAASGESATREQLDLILAELEDRFGKAPTAVRNLIEVTELRQRANRLGLKDVNLLGGSAKFQPVELDEAEQVQISHRFAGARYLKSARNLMIPIPKDEAGEQLRDEAIMVWLRKIFDEVIHPAQ